MKLFADIHVSSDGVARAAESQYSDSTHREILRSQLQALLSNS
jgi:hypothetical protein